MAPRPGSRPSLAGRTFADFEVLDELGAGGMGVVYRARDRRLERMVALKFLQPMTDLDAEARARFLREARAASALDHPNVGAIHGIVDGPEGEPCIVMAYYEGETLARRIAQGPLPVREAVRIALQVAEGLSAAHEKGIVHRDIKPSNVLICSSGVVKVLDFGLAKIADVDHTITKPDTILGTAQYMSPEQVRGEIVDPRADVWATGAILYEMLTGDPPFYEPDTYALLYAVVEKTPPPLSAIDAELERVVMKALAKKPEQRHSTIREFADDLRRASKYASAISEATTLPLATPASASKTKKQNPARFVQAALLFALALGIAAAAYWWVRGSSAGRETVAILPFTTGADPAAAALADGFAEALSGRIAQLESLKESLTLIPTADAIAKNVTNAREAKRQLGATVTVSGVLTREGATGLRLDLHFADLRRKQPMRVTMQDAKGDIRALEDRAALELSSLLEVRGVSGASETAGVTVQGYEEYLRGLGYLQRWDKAGNLDNALSAFGNAIRSDAKFARAYVGLAEASRTKYRVERDPANLQHALNYAQQAAQLDPKLADAHVVLGRLHQESMKRDLAVLEFQRALELQPRSVAALLGMARVYEDLGRLTEAENAHRRAVALNPFSWSAHNLLAGYYYRQRRFDDAETQYRRTVELTPDNAPAISNLAAVLLRQKKTRQARQMLERSLAVAPTYQAYVNLGNVDYGEGDFLRAASAYDKALQINSRDFRIWGTRAHALRLAKAPAPQIADGYRRAIALGEESLRVNARDAKTLSLIGLYNACSGDRSAAMPRLDSALVEGGSNADVLLDVATAYEVLGERENAAKWGKRALQAGVPWDEFANDRDLRRLVQSGAVRAPK